MKGFRRSRHQLVAVFEPAEAIVLSDLAAQVTDLLESRSARDTDPAMLRLLPDAYPDDADASAEFRRFTADGLAERKVANASRVVADLSAASKARTSSAVKVDAQSAQAWLRTLTDIRLTIASRLGIESDDDEPLLSEGTDQSALRDLYDWLGFVQGSLVDSLDG